MGPKISIASAIIDARHSLIEQSYAPREMVTGTINADGFGFGWYSDECDLPGTYHRCTPIWSDPDLPRLGRAVTSSCIMAAVRNATPGFDVNLQNVPPFVHQQLLFMHNGAVEGFHRRFRGPRVAKLPDPILATLHGSADSERIFALVMAYLLDHNMGRGVGADVLRDALHYAAETVLEIAREDRARASLNMGLSNGRAMAFVRLARGIKSNSLYLRRQPEAVWIASEPLDSSPEWEEVVKDTFVLVDSPTEVTLEKITDLPPRSHWREG
jgi:glutamine amidotransferase